jgi:2-amino-4-hydroxy-6-hydroxymethyldihydropteridine diphosphokinase
MPLANVYLSLGSNIGDRAANLQAAIAALPSAGIRVTQVSSIFETQPVDFLDQAWFLNCVVQGETRSQPLELLLSLRGIEATMGSKKDFPKGPRLIDIDILLYGDDTIDLAELQVPHPRMLQRRFVLIPLAEIIPNLRHPTWPATVAELLKQTPDRSDVRKFNDPAG